MNDGAGALSLPIPVLANLAILQSWALNRVFAMLLRPNAKIAYFGMLGLKYSEILASCFDIG